MDLVSANTFYGEISQAVPRHFLNLTGDLEAAPEILSHTWQNADMDEVKLQMKGL